MTISGKIVILNGVPRSGKSTLAHALQEQMSDVWINLGGDAAIEILPKRYRQASACAQVGNGRIWNH